MNGEKVKSFMQKSAGYLIAALISVVYIATSFIMPDETGKTISEIVIDGTLSFCIGMLLTQVFSIQGILRGNDDPRLLSTMKIHGEQVMRIAPFIDRLDDWCDEKTATALRRERTKVLARGGLRYCDCFDEDGVAKPFIPREYKSNRERRADKKREKLRRATYRRAMAVKITPLLAGTITGGGEKVTDPFDMGPSISEYERRYMRNTAITKVLIACIFGYYGIRLVTDFSYAELIWKVFQVATFCAMGVIQSNQSYLFIVDQYRRRITRSIDRLQEFESAMANVMAQEVDEKKEEDGYE